MSNLHPKQFKNYMPATQEGKHVSDWLSTNEGQMWQTHKHEAVHAQHLYEGNTGFYSVKNDIENDHDFWDTNKTAMNWVPGYDG